MAVTMAKQLSPQGLSGVSPPCSAFLVPEKWLRTAWACQRRRAISRSVLCGVMLFALGLVSLFTGQIAADLEWSRIRGRWRSKRVGYNTPTDIWKSEFANLYHGCGDRSPHFRDAVQDSESNGYLLIATSGGLNQQRTGITDAVVVARILNATLVVPELDHHSFWKDDSDFADIFDVDWFINSLSKDVTVVKRIPDKAVQLTKFDYRLTNKLDEELQKLRCRVNYHSLRFTKPIKLIGRKLVKRMRTMSSRYIAIHLRFEPDMLAFSGCYFGGGDKERNELGEIRKRWATLPDMSAEVERSRGKCPLTPQEVGLMLRALGFVNNTYLYVASGEIYGGEATLQPLKGLFPNFYTKEMLAGNDLKPFLPFSSRLAAIDYIVCNESDVFATNNNGNMAKILAGHRRYMGHKRTIRPNAKKLSSLFKACKQMEWEMFSRKVKLVQRGFMGEPDEVRPGRGDFHEFPSSCICQNPDHLVIGWTSMKPGIGGNETVRQLAASEVETSGR
ncbi:GDP-fucose protein O-fucosyltransferase [Musa troglodytarum]|uniref:O-fucosyltransferase family protein n=1 Tax=Musa troglodytarum TaxID=320322 RepID=A0A9E7F279_9LILI|nr:GDP-fucose protein O-fucosyltransferase [Musa troglodytarum]